MENSFLHPLGDHSIRSPSLLWLGTPPANTKENVHNSEHGDIPRHPINHGMLYIYQKDKSNSFRKQILEYDRAGMPGVFWVSAKPAEMFCVHDRSCKLYLYWSSGDFLHLHKVLASKNTRNISKKKWRSLVFFICMAFLWISPICAQSWSNSACHVRLNNCFQVLSTTHDRGNCAIYIGPSLKTVTMDFRTGCPVRLGDTPTSITRRY